MSWQRPRSIATCFDDEALWVLHSDQGVIVQLDPVAAAIWQSAIGASDAAEVVEELARHNGWEPHVIEEHVVRFLDDLIERGLLERSET